MIDSMLNYVGNFFFNVQNSFFVVKLFFFFEKKNVSLVVAIKTKNKKNKQEYNYFL